MNTPPTAARPATEARYDLAEGPLWDPMLQRLVWVDIPNGVVLVGRIVEDRVHVETQHHVLGPAGLAVLAADGAVLVAHGRQLTRIAPGGARTSTGTLDVVGSRDRFNDGVCDAAGRLLVGTLSLDGDHHSQVLLQIGDDGTRVLDDDLGLSNGLAFSPDGHWLYSVDSVPGRVWRRSYDHGSGATGTRQLFLDLSGETPDGLTVDAAGRLWIAIWGGGQVRCHTPGGDLVETVAVPAPHTSSVTFVGPALDRLAITTARSELTRGHLAEHPLSGRVFLADPGCRGLEPHVWSGRLPRSSADIPPISPRRPHPCSSCD